MPDRSRRNGSLLILLRVRVVEGGGKRPAFKPRAERFSMR